MFRYYQTSDKSPWSVVEDDLEHIKQALDDKATKMTILAVSEKIDEHTPQTSLSYKGPLYFDIDCKQDLYTAIDSGRTLVSKLKDLGIPNELIQIYCSGSKGMHVLVDQRALGTTKMVQMLPWVYAAIASELYVFGMDYQVYSSMKGNCWRLVNVRRSDGNYRVQITHEELQTLNELKYKEYVANARDYTPFPDPADKSFKYKPSAKLKLMFDGARTVAEKRIKSRSAIPPITTDQMEALKAETPPCVNNLVSGKIRQQVNYNQASFQLGIYLSSANLGDAEAKSLCGKLSESVKSDQYGTASARYLHSQGVVEYSRKLEYRFMCKAMLSILKTSPCGNCKYKDRINVVDDGDADDDGYIQQREDGYYSISNDGVPKQLTTFTFEVLEHHIPVESDANRRAGVTTRITSKHLNCKNMADIFLSEDSWGSRRNLVSELQGLGAASVYCSDTDIQRIKNYLFTKYPESEADVVKDSMKMGMQMHNIGNNTVRVYVEPNGSVNNMMVRNTHKLTKYIQSAPKLIDTTLPDDIEGPSRALEALSKINQPQHMAIIIGWAIAAHYKLHILEAGEGFPLLNVWGGAGAGKNQTVERVLLLNGVDYSSKDAAVVNIAGSTKWPAIDSASSSTTVPRILDECNEPQMSVRHKADINEILKSAWGSSSIPRGAIGRRPGEGARSVDIVISAPLAVLSEYSLSMPAVKQRSLQVQLSKKERSAPQYYSNYSTVVKNKHNLIQVAKLVMLDALKANPEEVMALVAENEKYVPAQLDDRPKLSYQIAYTGLDLLLQTMNRSGFSESCIAAIQHLKDVATMNIKDISRALIREKSRSVVDTTLADISLMVYMQSQPDTTTNQLMAEEGTHFAIGDGKLVIDQSIMFPIFSSWCQSNRKRTFIESSEQFLSLIRQETYYLTEARVAGFNLERDVLVLDLDAMEEKGLDVTLWGVKAKIPSTAPEVISIGL